MKARRNLDARWSRIRGKMPIERLWEDGDEVEIG